MDPLDDDLIRFRCAECGKVLGAKPGMRMVICSRCRLDNDVPTSQEAAESLSQAVRVVSVDVPFRHLLRLGLKASVAAIPLIVLLTIAACLVVQCARTGSTRNPDPSPPATPPAVQPDVGEQPRDSPPPPGILLGIGGVLLFALGTLFTTVIVLLWRDAAEPRYALLLAVLFLGFAPLALGSAMCWQYFF